MDVMIYHVIDDDACFTWEHIVKIQKRISMKLIRNLL